MLAERPRIARASRIRELVLGFQDGHSFRSPSTGLAGADAASSTVVVGGLAWAAALAVGTGAYPASQAENQLIAHEIGAEEQEYADHPEIEREEPEILLRKEDLSEEQVPTAAAAISSRVAC